MDKSITVNYRVDQFSNLLVKTLSYVYQLKEYYLSQEYKQQNLTDPIQIYQYLSANASQFDITKIAAQIPGVCSFSAQDRFGFILVQRKKGFLITPKIVNLCFMLEQSKNEAEFQEYLLKSYGSLLKRQCNQGQEAVLIESNLVCGKGLFLRHLLQKSNMRDDVSNEFLAVEESATSVIAQDFLKNYKGYKLNILLSDFTSIAQKMKKDDYPLFQKHPALSVIWGEKGSANEFYQNEYERDFSYIPFCYSKFDHQFKSEVLESKCLIILSLEYSLQKEGDMSVLEWINQKKKEDIIKSSSSVIIYSSKEEFLNKKVSLEQLQKVCPALKQSGNDRQFLREQIIQMFRNNSILQFSYQTQQILPKRNLINRAPLILWGDTNRTQENEKLYNRLRSHFSQHTVIQIFSSQEMRRIPLENPNSVHIVVMCGSFSQDVKNNISNMDWCQQSILEYDLNCTHVILFTSQQTIESYKWDAHFQKNNLNILISTEFKDLVNLIEKENFLNTL